MLYLSRASARARERERVLVGVLKGVLTGVHNENYSGPNVIHTTVRYTVFKQTTSTINNKIMTYGQRSTNGLRRT